MTYNQILTTAKRFADMDYKRGSYAAAYAAIRDMETLDDPEYPRPYYDYFVRCLNVIKDANDMFDQTNDEKVCEICRWAISGAIKDAEDEIVKLIDDNEYSTAILTRVIYDLAEHSND